LIEEARLMESSRLFHVVAAATFWLWASASAPAQVVERDASATGPRGRKVERHARVERGPGSLSRELSIQRPGGTYQREVQVQRGVTPTGRAYSERVVAARGGYAGRPVVVERGAAFGFAAPFFSFGFGSPVPPPPPPIVAVPGPVFVGPPPVVVAQPVAPAPPPRPYDAFTDAMGRLRSRHDNSRRDGARTLGQIGDPRAVPALIDLLRSDEEHEVRAAAAYALGSIGDPRARRPLAFAAQHDRRRDVRQAAAEAYAELGAETAPVEEAPVRGFDDPDQGLAPGSELPPPPPDAPDPGSR
jgi:hypothetical protein